MGVDEFMNDSIVLPPGEWDREELLESYTQIRTQSHVIKERRRAMTRGPTSQDFGNNTIIIIKYVYLVDHFRSCSQHGAVPTTPRSHRSGSVPSNGQTVWWTEEGTQTSIPVINDVRAELW